MHEVLNYDPWTLQEKEIPAKQEREIEVPEGYATAKGVDSKVGGSVASSKIALRLCAAARWYGYMGNEVIYVL